MLWFLTKVEKGCLECLFDPKDVFFINRLFYGYGDNNVGESSVFSQNDCDISTKVIEYDFDEENISLWYSDNQSMFKMDKEKKFTSETVGNCHLSRIV